LSASDDQADVEKVLLGDLTAFEGIVRRWQRPLINMAYRFCHDRARAEDMAQEAFLRAYRALPKWRQESSFSTWLFAVAANLYRSELKRIPPAVPLSAIADLATAHAPAHSPDQSVRLAVDALPAKYRDVMTLFYFHEKDVAATALSLGVPEGTVKARLSRGREILRRKLPQFLATLQIEDV
jgi:RNA polymerase sigma-70 factor (ECF subfamily)